MVRTMSVQVFGPAYLDRVLRVDGPLHAPGERPLDRSVDGVLSPGAGLKMIDASGAAVSIQLPNRWPGPTGSIALMSGLQEALVKSSISVVGLSWRDDLGGMGAGFASALGGELRCVLGGEEDPISLSIVERLAGVGIQSRPVRVPNQSADWTLLVTSGAFGDKLPVGFRGCHASLQTLGEEPANASVCDLRIVAALPNRLADEALRGSGARVRMFAPSMRNMTDRLEPLVRFAHAIDILSCNRHEWESLAEREQVAWQVSVLAVTDGPNGSTLRFTRPDGEPGRVVVPAFPRSDPIRDTNRAGETYASTLVSTLLKGGWSPGVLDSALAEKAVLRASAASALVLDRLQFGFPTPEEIDAAIQKGRVDRLTGGGER